MITGALNYHPRAGMAFKESNTIIKFYDSLENDPPPRTDTRSATPGRYGAPIAVARAEVIHSLGQGCTELSMG